MRLRKVFTAALLAFAILPALMAQEENRISPVNIASISYKDTYVKVVYGQPSKRNRQIFGKLIPYNTVWRTGANEATEIIFTRDVIIENQTVAAGIYSLFTIPGEKEWVIILNKDLGMWGAYNYNSKSDVVRWTIPIEKLKDRSVERFSIEFRSKNNIADMVLCWDDICVTLPINFMEPKK